jgi:hypothetical protein
LIRAPPDWQAARVIESLLASDEPSIRWRARNDVLRQPFDADLSEEVRSSARVRSLLSERQPDGTIPAHPYAKWRGAHWVLAVLAELGYPRGDTSLTPLREQVLSWLLSEAYAKRWIRKSHGLCRMHASQDANAIWYLLRLGLEDERVERLVERLLDAQWPDGGWNCDPRESAHISSFEETLIPLRALSLFAQRMGSKAARAAVDNAVEVFLSRRLHRRRSDGHAIAERFLLLAFPRYWHYDFLFGLKVVVEAGFVTDPRCRDALDLLETKRLADGGFPAETRYYRSPGAASNASLVSWGGTSRRRSNPWVTTDALAVLAAANQIDFA